MQSNGIAVGWKGASARLLISENKYLSRNVVELMTRTVLNLDIPGLTWGDLSTEVINKKLESKLYPEKERGRNRRQKAKQLSWPPWLPRAHLHIPGTRGERGTR